MMTAGGKNACISPRIPSGKSIRERKRKLGALLYASCVALGNLVSLNLIFCVKGLKRLHCFIEDRDSKFASSAYQLDDFGQEP